LECLLLVSLNFGNCCFDIGLFHGGKLRQQNSPAPVREAWFQITIALSASSIEGQPVVTGIPQSPFNDQQIAS
jgi:hypothetical protein